MTIVTRVFLHALHLVYTFALFVWRWQHLARTSPQPFKATRRRIPKHLALVLVPDLSPNWEEILIRSVVDTVGWCREIGISKLTLYDEHGRLQERVGLIRKHLSCDPETTDTYRSDNMNTESIHLPDAPITLCLGSRKSSKQVIASIASSFASQTKLNRTSERWRKENGVKYELSVDTLHASLVNDADLSPPDLLIFHSICSGSLYKPLELHGFPPWHMTLSEMYLTTPMQRSPIDEVSFRLALDQFSRAEMRLGK